MPAPLPENNEGYVLLVSVLIIGLIATAAVTSTLLWSTDGARTGAVSKHAAQAYAASLGCATQAFSLLSSSSAFTGSESLSIGTGECTLTVADDAQAEKVVHISSTNSGVTRRSVVTISALNPLTIDSWKDVPDF